MCDIVRKFVSLLVLGGAVLAQSAYALEGAVPLAPGVFPAVGRVSQRCTGTLIEDRRVLTAAHCVCEVDASGRYSLSSCAARASFEFVGIGSTSVRGQRIDVRVDGRVRVHPEFSAAGWLREDLAVIELDRPASQIAPGVAPIPVEGPVWVPAPGTPMRLVGFGHSGRDCKGPAAKRMLDAPLTHAESARLMIRVPGKRNCPGDSGGPMLDSAGRVAGVMSWTGDEINGRPTHANFNFIFDLPQPGWADCHWNEVGRRSHQVGAPWCPSGSFLTQFDLDGERSLDAHDAPIVGRAQCCRIAAVSSSWGNCRWASVGARRSFERDGNWCSDGEFLAGLDLDGDRNLPAGRTPVIGQALCCRPQGGPVGRWGSTFREPVGGVKSHGRSAAWCPSGSFLTRVELTAVAGAADHDNPVVGHATCARPRP